MKKTIRLIGLCALAMLAAVACKKNEEKNVTFKATLTQPASDSRTHIDGNNDLVWNSGDEIKVYTADNAEASATTFSTTSNNTMTATFSGTLAESASYTAFYPAEGVNVSGSKILMPLKATQTFVDGNINSGDYPMYATGTGETFTFHSPAGLLMLKFAGSGTIGSVVLTDKNGANLAGNYEVDNSGCTFVGNAATVTLSCGEGVDLDPVTETVMYFVLPDGVFANGFTAVVNNTAGSEMYTLATTNDNHIVAEKILEMPTLNIAAISVTTGAATPNADTPSTVTIGGSYNAPTGMSVSEVGFYWGQGADLSHRQPATLDNPFVYTLEGLEEGTEYSYQAYAVNGSNEILGSVETFTTLTSVPVGAIKGMFTINSDGDQVYFSKGNLQYIGSAGNGDETNTGAYWKFADNQWDYFGTAQNGSSQTIDRDLFGFGTSGYNHGATCWQPWSTTGGYSYYYVYGTANKNLCDAKDDGTMQGQADWGYNAISNGGNTENIGWRTLTQPEWSYIIYSRSGIRWTAATVNGIKGIILLPDNWTASIYALNDPNSGDYNSNNITAADWINILEANGAVFLPAAGYRSGTSASYVGGRGYYWSAYYNHAFGGIYGYYTDFENGTISTTNESGFTRQHGFSVRLVRDAE